MKHGLPGALTVVLLLSAGIAAAVLLAGCGKKGNSQGPSQAPAATSAPVSEAASSVSDKETEAKTKPAPETAPDKSRTFGKTDSSKEALEAGEFADVDDGGAAPLTTGPLPDSPARTLTGLRFTSQGMMVRPSYSIRKVPEGFECAITYDPIYWPAMDGKEGLEGYEVNADRGYAWDPVNGSDPLAKDAPMHSAVIVGDDEMRILYNQLMDANVLEWNGYDEVWEPPYGLEVTDTGETFTFELLFSDGAHLKAHGVDSFPDNYDTVVKVIYDFFDEHQDYSAYYPTEFPAGDPTVLIVKFYDPHHFNNTPNFQIELHPSWDKEWIIRITDPKGEFAEAGSDISEYGYIKTGELPMGRFMDIIRKYDLGSWNQRNDHEQGGADEYWEIRAEFNNGQSYHVYTNYRPDNYSDFRKEMIRAICDYYKEVKK